MKSLFLTFIMAISIGGYCQDTTYKYYDADWEACKKGEHEFYGYRLQLEDNLYAQYDFYKDGQPQMTGYYVTDEGDQMHGLFTYFTENGDTSSIATYDRGKQLGPIIKFRWDGVRSVKTTMCEDGQCGPTIYYNSKGTPASKGMFKSGYRTGHWQYYDYYGNVVGDEYFVQEYTAPNSFSITLPPAWFSVQPVIDTVIKGVNSNRLWRKNVYGQGGEQYYCLDVTNVVNEEMTDKEVARNIIASKKGKPKKIKNAPYGKLNFEGSMYSFEYEEKGFGKLKSYIFTQKKGDNILILHFTFDQKVNSKALGEIEGIVNSISW